MLPPSAKRKENRPEPSDVDSETRTGRGESSPPRREPLGSGGRAGRIHSRPLEPRPRPHPKFLEIYPAPQGPRKLRPIGRARTEAQVTEPGARPAPAPRSAHRPDAPGRPAPRGRAGPGRATWGNHPGPRRPGAAPGLCSPGLRTAAEIKRQKTRRQEGAAFGAIFLLLLGSPRRSPRRRSRRGRRSVPGAAGALAGRDAGGSRFSQTHRPPGLRAPHLRVCAARNFPPRSGQLLLPPFSARPGPLWLLLPGRRPSLLGRHLSNSERCTCFFLPALLLPFSRNNNADGGGSVRKKPVPGRNGRGWQRGGRRVQAVSAGGSR